jgi:hypothetical protein
MAENPPTLFDKNITALERRFPALAGAAIAARDAALSGDGSSYEVCPARSGAPTLYHAGKALHSPYDPETEAARLVHAAKAGGGTAAEAIVVLGFGLGYLAEAAAAGCGDVSAGVSTGVPVVVVERRMEVFVRALLSRDLNGARSMEVWSVLRAKPEVVPQLVCCQVLK